MTLRNLTPDSILSTAEASELIGVGEERIRQLEKAGYIKKIERGRWNLTEVVQGYLHFLREKDW